MRKLTQQQFIEKSNIQHRCFYDYSKSIYTGCDNDIIIICPLHGQFIQIADDHLRGRGCRKCGRKSITDKLYTTTKEIIFREDDISYYLLGAFLTDGCVVINKSRTNSTYCKITSKDEDWIQSICNFLNNEPKISRTKNCFNLLIYSQDIFDWLVSYNCVPAKSLILEMPDIPNQYLPDFIRGCIDGDGSISCGIYTNNRGHRVVDKKLYICGSSLLFLEKIQKKLSDNSIIGKIYQQKPSKTKIFINNKEIIRRNPHYRLYFTGKQAIKLVQWAYYIGHKLSMPRKNHKSQELIKLS